MNLPGSGDYIDIHTHGSVRSDGLYCVENLMAHESVAPDDIPETACSYGIHPWHLLPENYDGLLGKVRDSALSDNLIAFGEAGFDRMRGPSMELQNRAFEQQALIAEEFGKPLIIHCVKAWEELFSAHRKLKPSMPWLVHGFRGNHILAKQIISKGINISLWFDVVTRPGAASLLKTIMPGGLFLETDGADVDIRDIYESAASHLEMTIVDLKSLIRDNFLRVFGMKKDL
jgi:TatD DNase family protein